MGRTGSMPGDRTFLTDDLRVPVEITREPDTAAAIGITERAAQAIVTQLDEAGYISRARAGRRDDDCVDPSRPFRHPAEADDRIEGLLTVFTRHHDDLAPRARSDEVTRPWGPMNILVVEDDAGDQLLIQEAFADSDGGPAPRLAIVEDGQEALDFLHRRGTHTGAFRPDLVLLDLNLPKYSGRAVLEQIKNDADLRSIPVIIFTTSASTDDVTGTYLLHANAYVTKPVDFDDFTHTVRQINGFFTRTARLPRPPAAA